MLFCIGFGAEAYDFIVDDLQYTIENDGSVSVTGFNSYLNGNINIPESVTYSGNIYTVKYIGMYAFENCSKITSIIIPNTVLEIGMFAFSGCNQLVTIDIPNSVYYIGKSAFINTQWYNNQPDGMVYAGMVAYKYKGLMPDGTNIELIEGCKGIAGDAFRGCTGLISISIPNTVNSIGSGAFYGCSNLPSVVIPNTITWIDYETFYGCSKLTSFTIPNSVTYISDNSFMGCTELKSIIIPNSVTQIGYRAFYNCTSLKTAIIGENVLNIGEKAFGICSSLENLVSLKERPIVINSNTFTGVPTASCDLHVREGSKIRYENQDVWKDFLIILEDAEDYADGTGSLTPIKGDVNGDGVVTAADVTEIYNILLGNE